MSLEALHLQICFSLSPLQVDESHIPISFDDPVVVDHPKNLNKPNNAAAQEKGKANESEKVEEKEGKNDDKHAILAKWGDSLSRAFLTAAEGEEVGEKDDDLCRSGGVSGEVVSTTEVGKPALPSREEMEA